MLPEWIVAALWIGWGKLRSGASFLVAGLLHLHPIRHWSRPVWSGLKVEQCKFTTIREVSEWESEQSKISDLVRPDVLQAAPAHKVAAHHSTLLFLQEEAGCLTPCAEFCQREDLGLSLAPCGAASSR